MDSCSVDPHWTLHGLRAIRVSNRHLEVVILPDLGGKIWSFIDKASDRDLLWHSPRVVPHRAPLHANFDDHWSGGWDEAFPGGAAGLNQFGDALPYLGELWTNEAELRIIEAGPRRVELALSMNTPITPARWERRLVLEQGSTLEIHYRLTNVGFVAFDFNWGIHPALDVGPTHRLDVPARKGEVDESGGDLLGHPGDRYEYPMLRGFDVREAQSPGAKSFALHYLSELDAGWVATTDRKTRRGFALTFDKDVFRSVWAWMVYGGWRGYQHAILEPWIGYPSSLAEASAAGRTRHLAAGEELETTVRAHLTDGIDAVSAVTEDGLAVQATV